MQSYIFDFKKSTSFMQKWNREFDVEDLTSSTFYIVLVDENCPNNFSQCINQETGRLIFTQDQYIQAECELNYVVTNNVENISLNNDCVFDFNGEDYPTSFKMKGAFLTNDDGYVMGYSINQYSVTITTQMTFEKDLILFDITEGAYYGE